MAEEEKHSKALTRKAGDCHHGQIVVVVRDEDYFLEYGKLLFDETLLGRRFHQVRQYIFLKVCEYFLVAQINYFPPY